MFRSAGLALLAVPLISFAVEDCDFSVESANKHEQRIMSAAAAFSGGELWEKVRPSLQCLLRIHEQGSGALKYLAGSYLRPMLGAPQTRGLKTDHRYKKIADLIAGIASKEKDVINKSVMAEYARGDWGFYKLMCGEGSTEFCSVFLPDLDRVKSQSPVLAAASMLELRTAYYVLDGKQKDKIAERIKQLYLQIPQQMGLQRRVIDEIYWELFSHPTPLSSLS